MQAAWAAPVIVVAVAAPAAAASETSAFEIVMLNPVMIPSSEAGETVPVFVRNGSATTATGTVGFVVTGMSRDGLRLQTLPGVGWTSDDGSGYTDTTFTWTGTLGPGESSDAKYMTINYVGSVARPYTGTLVFAPSEPGIDGFTVTVIAEA